MMDHYQIGAGKADITDSRTGLQLQGMADPGQRTTGVQLPLYARAFVIADAATKVAILIADIWACTKLLKDEVLKALEKASIFDFNEETLLIAGTHTHSAPGGYTSYRLFDQPFGKVDPTTLRILVDGMAASIKIAINNQRKGRIYVNKGPLFRCGEQRSLPAYENNPLAERDRYAGAVDNEMLLLKFVQEVGDEEIPIGLLNWYAIHPTDLGQFNTLVSGDNKGLASAKMEQYAAQQLAAPGFVAAFANSNCGDVSGNVPYGVPDGTHDEAHLDLHGELQFQKAKALFADAKEMVQGDLQTWYSCKDLCNITIQGNRHRTFPYALGLSITAGSSEDSIPRYYHPVCKKIRRVSPVIREGLTRREVGINALGGYLLMVSFLLAVKFWTKLPLFLPARIKRGHYPKPIVFAPQQKATIVPHDLPLQIIGIGNFAILGIPAEITTMAGRRLRERVYTAFSQIGRSIDHIALSAYANDYAQYITTKEEYEMQHYEGASTPFGPHTLAAYVQLYEEMIGVG